MGLLQKCFETYESHFDYATENRTGSVMMAPVGHTVVVANIEITLDMDGKFIGASPVDKSDQKTIIPATEGSAGRTSNVCAHPLCDNLGYLLPENKKKYKQYVEQLSAWEASKYSHEKLKPILTYIKGGTILKDLATSSDKVKKIIKLNDDGKITDKKTAFGVFVRWKISGTKTYACWLDKTLFKAFTEYYSDNISNRETGFCMVSGKNTIPAEQHPRGVVSQKAKAKLVSTNDTKNFTFLGRFTGERQAIEIGYEVSQKAHNALRWLVQEKDQEHERAVFFGGRTFLCWNPQGKFVLGPFNPLLKKQKPAFRPSEYHEELRNALSGRKAELEISDGVVIAVLDAATDGRLSLTYYNELGGHDFLDRLYDWDASCCWSRWSRNTQSQRDEIQSPKLEDIVNYAFGTQRIEAGQARMVTDDRILSEQMQRMMICRIDKAFIGTDVLKALVNHCSSLQTYKERDEKRGGKQKEDIRDNLLFITCAVIRKYRMDRFKEEWKMALEPKRRDRSYQFGRLLAVMEKVERDTYGKDETREPNAIRLQSIFCKRPMSTQNLIEEQLAKAYFPRLKPKDRTRYKNLMGEIMEVISSFPDVEWNKPLGETYLMGYYLQRNELHAKKNNNETEENENEQADE